jgi:hypothetical protein
MPIRWFDTKSVAAICGVTRETVNDWCGAGKLRFMNRVVKLGSMPVVQKRIPETALAEFLSVHWAPDRKKFPNAIPITLDHLLEWGVKTGGIKNVEEVPDADISNNNLTPKKRAAVTENLKKAADARGVARPGEKNAKKKGD